MICTECHRPITKDAASGRWPRGPVGPVCAKAMHIRQYLRAQKVAQRIAKQAPRRARRVRVVECVGVDPRQLHLQLEVL